MKKNKQKEPDLIKILNFKENADGSANYDFEVSEEFIELYKKHKNIKKVTQKGLSDFILQLIKDYVNEAKNKRLKK